MTGDDCFVEAFRYPRRSSSVASSGSSSAPAAAPVIVSSVQVEPEVTQELGREGTAVTSPTADFKSNLHAILNDILPGMILSSLSSVLPSGGCPLTGTAPVTVPAALSASTTPVLAAPGVSSDPRRQRLPQHLC